MTKLAIKILHTEGLLRSDDERIACRKRLAKAVYCLKNYHGIDIQSYVKNYPESRSRYVEYILK